MKKYEITDIAHPDNPNLHRIRAVTDLTENVLAGMLGGYVESRDNLDQVYFNYLVINLVDNAIKYGGDEPWVKVVFYRENWDWVLTVTDRGIGMPERVLKRIFRQFYRVKDKKVKNKTGFGLGLAFAKKVVNAYGGEIRVESAPGKGSRFEVRIKAE